MLRIDSIEELTIEVFQTEMPKEPLENCLVCAGTTRDDNVEIAQVAIALESPCAKFKHKGRYFEELGKSKPLPPPFNV